MVERPSPTTDPLRVVVVDDDPRIRRLLELQLRRCGRYRLVGQADTLAGGLTAVTDATPDVALVDLTLGTDWGGDLVGALACAAPTTMLAVLSSHPAELQEDATRATGAFVYYEKSMIVDLPRLLAADHDLFRRALAGEDVVAPGAVTRRLALA